MKANIQILMNQLRSPDYLLREMVFKELWTPAIVFCDSAIEDRRRDIEILERIKTTIKEGE